jgi:hypothetical protein
MLFVQEETEHKLNILWNGERVRIFKILEGNEIDKRGINHFHNNQHQWKVRLLSVEVTE